MNKWYLYYVCVYVNGIDEIINERTIRLKWYFSGKWKSPDVFLKVKSRGIPSSVSCRLYTGPFELNLWGLTDNTVKRTRCCSICRRRATSQRVADIIQLSTLSEMRIYFCHVFQISKKAMHFLKHFIRFNFIYIMCIKC